METVNILGYSISTGLILFIWGLIQRGITKDRTKTLTGNFNTQLTFLDEAKQIEIDLLKQNHATDLRLIKAGIELRDTKYKIYNTNRAERLSKLLELTPNNEYIKEEIEALKELI